MTQGAKHMKLWLAVLVLGLGGIGLAYFASTALGENVPTATAYPGLPYCTVPTCDAPGDNPNNPPAEPFPVDPAADDDKLGKPVDSPAAGKSVPHKKATHPRFRRWGWWYG